MLAGLALVLGLALAALGGAGSALAQAGPTCTTFGSGDPAGFHPCQFFPNITITTGTTGSLKGTGDYYLQLSDDPNASAACSSDPALTGDWIAKMGGCGQFCFDMKVFAIPLDPTMIVYPAFTLYLPGGINAGLKLDFQSTVPATSSAGIYPGWHKICAPIREIVQGESLPSNGYGYWVIHGSTAYDQAFNQVLHNVGEMQLPVDYTSQPSEIVGYDNLCFSEGGCSGDGITVTGCLKNAVVKIECNGDGTYTLSLNDTSFPGDEITLTSETSGVTVVQSHQPWAAQTNWTITGATGGQTITLAANVTRIGAGSREGTDLCCSGEITIVMPDCPPPKTGVLKFIKDLKGAPPGVDLSLWHYPITVSCDNGMGGSFSLAASQTGTLPSIPFGTLCTVHEDPSQIDLPTGCPPGTTPQWQPPTYSLPQPVTIGPNPVTTVTVSNLLLCVGGRTGSLTIQKTAIQDGIDHTSQQLGDFQIDVVCQNPASQQTVTLTHANGYQFSLPSLPVGAICTITEQPQNPSVLPPGYTWLPTPATQTITIQPGAQTAHLNNSIVPVPSGGLRITKTCGPASSVPGTTDLQAACLITVTATASPLPATIVLTDALQGPINVPGYENKIISMTSAQNWSCPAMPILAGTNGVCQLPGSDLAAAGGQSVIHAVVQFHDAGNATETQNCVSASGLDQTGATVATAPQVCVGFSAGMICQPGTTLRGGACVPVNECASPFIPNDAGKCVCPEGFAEVGKSCLPIISCKAPKVPVNDGTACACPDGTVEKGNRCVKPVAPVLCKAPLVLNEAGKCDCPDGLILKGKRCVQPVAPVLCLPPLVPNKAGKCECPDGLTLKGRECIKPVAPLACPPPLVPNRAGKCDCPAGLILKGGECVKPVAPLVCPPPSIPNKAQSACICPRGTIETANGCSLPEPDIKPDVIDKPTDKPEPQPGK